MLDLKREFDLTYLYITHDLATAKFFCDRIAIMYLGRIVEMGPSEAIYADPKHPYTKALLRAIPEPDPRRTIPRDLPRGEVPDAARPPLGCSFHPRCPNAFEVCGWETRDLRDLLEARWARMGEEQFEIERREVGDLSVLNAPATSVRLAGEAAANVLDAFRAESPEDPFWKGVKRIERTEGHVEVEFNESLDPRPLPAGAVQVECHLYDGEALQRAEAAKAPQI
jgi:peptide/nickel transport system ATP-binding protein